MRIAAATPLVRVADCKYNAERIIALAFDAAREGASLVVFPELSISAYTCGDLFLQRKLLIDAQEALLHITEQTASLDMLTVVGLPVASGAALYNCAAVLYHGEILALIPKQNIPNYTEFYELRHFTPGPAYQTIPIGKRQVPFGYEIILACTSMPEFVLGIELCEDLWVSTPPSCRLAESGATVLCNLSASDEIIGKSAYRRELTLIQSARLLAAYLYCDAGEGESSTDMVYAGHNMIAENGVMLRESTRFTTGLTIADVDLQRLVHERRRTNTFGAIEQKMHVVPFDLSLRSLTLTRAFAPHPFVPSGQNDLAQRCDEILTLQSVGLATRLRHIGCKAAVIGLSGGLDSTLALIVTAHAFDRLGLPRSGILTVTMPGLGTTERTKNNAKTLSKAYGATLMEISISKAVEQHFKDIGQDEQVHDITYENSQARERTQVLMDIANQKNAIVVGTGDLTELALGFATYNGDHMSMYGVNCSIPKTLVRHLVAYEASRSTDELSAALFDVLQTPISPELLPPVDGEISQKTEDIVGPYELHDFTLYYMLRFGYCPAKIFRLANMAFSGMYSPAQIKKWLIVFIQRFFSQQFKRSCLPDGPKVGSVTLSPRGDFRMPSDAVANSWLLEAQAIDVRKE